MKRLYHFFVVLMLVLSLILCWNLWTENERVKRAVCGISGDHFSVFYRVDSAGRFPACGTWSTDKKAWSVEPEKECTDPINIFNYKTGELVCKIMLPDFESENPVRRISVLAYGFRVTVCEPGFGWLELEDCEAE